MTITLPIPNRGLWPNSHGHWTKRSRLVKKHRWWAQVKTMEALAGRPAPVFTGYALAFHFPDARRRDDDNAAAACKSYRDGIADALRVDDNTLRLASLPTFAIDRENPRLEITLIP